MTLLHKAFDAKKFDVRLLEKNVSRGMTQAADVEEHLKQLPDDAENAEYISLETFMGDGEAASTEASPSDSAQTHH